MKALRFLLLTLLFTGVFLGFSVCALNLFLPPLLQGGATRVPEVRGLPLAEAKKILSEAGLKLKVEEIPSRDYPPEVVISQKPLPGKKVKRGRRVILTVSKGAKPVRVPDLKGQEAEHAQAELRKRGLVPRVIEIVSQEVEPGLVVDTRPMPGELIREGDTVTVIVSLGVPIEVMPDTVLNEADTSGALESPGGGDAVREGSSPGSGP